MWRQWHCALTSNALRQQKPELALTLWWKHISSSWKSKTPWSQNEATLRIASRWIVSLQRSPTLSAVVQHSKKVYKCLFYALAIRSFSLTQTLRRPCIYNSHGLSVAPILAAHGWKHRFTWSPSSAWFCNWAWGGGRNLLRRRAAMLERCLCRGVVAERPLSSSNSACASASATILLIWSATEFA